MVENKMGQQIKPQQKGDGMADQQFAVGQKVKINDEGGYVIVKLMTQTAKVEKDGKTSIKPLVMLESNGVNQDGGNSERMNQPKIDAPKSRRRPANGTPKVEKPKEKSKAPKAKKSKAEKPKAEKPKKNMRYIGPGADPDDTPASVPSEQRQYPRNKGDAVSKYFADADTFSKLETAVRKHPAFGSINEKSFRNTLKKAKSLQFGLLRMRMGNLIRGAISRAKKSK